MQRSGKGIAFYRFDIPMEHPVMVQVAKAEQYLQEKPPYAFG